MLMSRQTHSWASCNEQSWALTSAHRYSWALVSSFTQEPYILNITNKSLRAWLTRYRVSAVPNLGIESGRYTRPVTPVTSRLCKFGSSNSIDDEKHVILQCNTFILKRNCFFGRLTSLLPNFEHMRPKHKLLTSFMSIKCPNSIMRVQISENNIWNSNKARPWLFKYSGHGLLQNLMSWVSHIIPPVCRVDQKIPNRDTIRYIY